jgi:D-aminopeptidase
MLVAVSVDMEGASQLRSVREIFGCMPEYWETGKPRLEADVAAACEGLLAGGASELVVLDNHGGNTVNVSPESLPPGARLETWNVYELREHGVDAMFQAATTRVAASTVSFPTPTFRVYVYVSAAN